MPRGAEGGAKHKVDHIHRASRSRMLYADTIGMSTVITAQLILNKLSTLHQEHTRCKLGRVCQVLSSSSLYRGRSHVYATQTALTAKKAQMSVCFVTLSL